MTEPREALDRLAEGNRRFVAGQRRSLDPSLRESLLGDQKPIAVVLGCADSRVPVEIVFDQGLGDLFVIRVAGNVVAPSQIGSVEFAVDRFGVKLVVVLGHTRCGAIRATLDELRRPSAEQSPNLRAIVDRIRPAAQTVLDTPAPAGESEDGLERRAIRANVRAAADQLRHGSELIERLVSSGDLLIVGAEYALETGVVDVFDGAS